MCRVTSRVCRGAGGGAGASDDVTGEIFSKTPVVPMYHHVCVCVCVPDSKVFHHWQTEL